MRLTRAPTEAAKRVCAYVHRQLPQPQNPTTITECGAPVFPTRTHRKAGHRQVHEATLAETEALDLEHPSGILLNAQVMYHSADGGGLQQASERPDCSDGPYSSRTRRCCRHKGAGRAQEVAVRPVRRGLACVSAVACTFVPWRSISHTCRYFMSADPPSLVVVSVRLSVVPPICYAQDDPHARVSVGIRQVRSR